jgi:hypothetical protein
MFSVVSHHSGSNGEEDARIRKSRADNLGEDLEQFWQCLCQ